MSTWKAIYRSLDRIQQQGTYRLVATVIALGVCIGYFGTLVVKTHSLENQRQELHTALEGQNLHRGDLHATSLSTTNSVTINNRTYRLDELEGRPDAIFDDDGYVAVPLYVAGDLIQRELPGWAPTWLIEQPQTTTILGVAMTAWLLLVIWLNVTLPMLLTFAGTFIPAAILWWFGREQAMVSVAGIGLLVFTFILLSRAMMAVFDRPNQICAVAHTVVKEASRRRLSLSFIVLLLVLLPLLPLWLDPEAPLRYRIQTFISRGVSLTFVIAACMTLFLSCATVAFEIRDRQIWQLVTKPLHRFNYILGKWLGVVSVNVIILLVAGISIFIFIQYLRTLPVAPGIDGQLDEMQVEHAVLTARKGIQPTYHYLEPEQIRDFIQRQIDDEPDLSASDITFAEQRRMAEEIQQRHLARQRSIPAGGERHYLFEGLDQAKDFGAPLTLRYLFYILDSDPHENYPVIFVINQDPNMWVERSYVPTLAHVQTIGSDLIRDDGSLLVTVGNPYVPPPGFEGYGSINFETEDFELLYKVATFEGNFLRAMLMLWVKLAFLAMLGICCGTFLSFPVACLLSFTIFIGGTMAPYLATSIEYYQPVPMDMMDWSNVGMVVQWVFQSFIRLIAQTLVFALEAFGAYQPTQSLAEGRAIPWIGVGTTAATIGVFWSGTALLIGYLVLRSRQLAIYSGQG